MIWIWVSLAGLVKNGIIQILTVKLTWIPLWLLLLRMKSIHEFNNHAKVQDYRIS